jgi:polar amino acid transport system substrate-binding protein
MLNFRKFLRVLSVYLAISCICSGWIFSWSTSAADLETIKARGKLIIGVKDNLRPLGFRDAQGNLQGLEIDIAKHLAEVILGDSNAVIFKPVNNLDRLDLVIQNQVDLTIAQTGASSSRSRIVDCSVYYYLDGTGLVTKNPKINNLTVLNRQKIAVLEGSVTVMVIKSEFPQAQLIGVKSYQEALNLLETQAADLFAGDNSVLSGWVQEYSQYRQLPVRLSANPLCVVMPKGLQYESLRHQVRHAITSWHQSGWLEERANYWGLP